MSDPFRPLTQSIPVVAGRSPYPPLGTEVIRIETSHSHDGGVPCPACEANTDLRARLFDLLVSIRNGDVALPEQVVIESAKGPAAIEDALVQGRRPLRGLRDRTVLKSFHAAP